MQSLCSNLILPNTRDKMKLKEIIKKSVQYNVHPKVAQPIAILFTKHSIYKMFDFSDESINWHTYVLLIKGDIRVNEQPGLTSIHTLWVREHNRVVEELIALHGFAEATVEDREFLYQSARRIVIAEYQVKWFRCYLKEYDL